MSKRLIVLLAGVLAIAAAAAGCGSDDDGDTATLTKQQFIAKADAICRKGNTEINEGFESFAKENDIPKNKEPSDAQGVEIVETVIVPSIQGQSDSIRELGAPEGDEAQVEQLLDSLDEAIEGAEDDPESLFDEKSDPFGDVNKEAREYGLKVCGQE